MVLGDAEEHEVFREVPVRLAELPERAADRVESGGRHVDGAEAAVRGVVRRAELLCPPARQRLRLVAPGEEGKTLRIGGADVCQSRRRYRECLFPFDLAEISDATLADAKQRLAQARRAVVLHDPGGALAADHAAIHRVALVTLDVADLSVGDMHVDAAAAGAHVAGGLLHLVGDERRGVDAVALDRCTRIRKRALRRGAVRPDRNFRLHVALGVLPLAVAEGRFDFGPVPRM